MKNNKAHSERPSAQLWPSELSKDPIRAQILKDGKATVALEASSIEVASNLLSDEFVDVVLKIVSLSRGSRVIVSAVGKAGFVGMKFSATLSSIGLPSWFLHPVDAMHGDLGRCCAGDIAVLLSTSGETNEVVRLIPHLKGLGISVIAITSEKNSSLAQGSDLVLPIQEVIEACPLGLAPTTSTAVMLSICDAISIAVLNQIGTSKKLFGTLHPGGKLGQRLTKVEQVMRTGESHCIVSEDLTCREAITKIAQAKNRAGSATVIDSKGELAGFFSDGDLRRCLLMYGEGFLDRPISTSMSKSPKRVKESQPITDAIGLMKEYMIDEVVVVNEKNQPVGIVDIQDIP